MYLWKPVALMHSQMFRLNDEVKVTLDLQLHHRCFPSCLVFIPSQSNSDLLDFFIFC